MLVDMKRLFALGILLSILVLRWLACGSAPEKGPVKDLTNRIWVSKVTQDPREMVLHLVLFQKERRQNGVVVAASNFRFAGDVINYRLNGEQLTLGIPQDQTQVTFKVRTWACPEAPKPLDWCLELRQGDRALVLFSRRKSRLAENGSDRVESLLLGGRPMVGGDSEVTCDDCDEATPRWFEEFTPSMGD